jgi:CBS domain-containing protein
MELAKTLKRELVRHLPLPDPIILAEETPIAEAIKKMQEARRGCVLIEKGSQLAGLVTERDILVKYIGSPSDTFFTLKEIMTASPTTLSPEVSLEKAIQVMTEGGYRHVPLVDSGNHILGVVSARNIVSYIAEHFPAEVFNLPPRLEQKMESPEGA